MYLASFDDSLVFDAVDRWFSGALDIRYLFGTADVCDCSAAGYENAAMCYPTPSAATSCAPDSEGGADAQTGVACCDTYPDSTTRNWLDTDGAAMLPGSTRLQRGLNYVGYLGARWSHLRVEAEVRPLWGPRPVYARPFPTGSSMPTRSPRRGRV